MASAEESALRVAIDRLLEGVQIIAFDWRYLYVNETAAVHGDRPAAQLVGRRMTDCYPGIDETPVFEALRRVMAGRTAEQVLNEFAYPDGRRRWFELRIEPVPDGICVLSIDVTERQRLDAQLQQAQKLEAIGQLAGGVAHDFNNMLTAILGYAELITHQIGPDKPIGEDLREIVMAANRAAALTRQLLAFSRQQGVVSGPVSLPRIVKGLAPMLQRLIPENIRIETRLEGHAPAIRAHASQVEQILINLVVNARDAMPDGGTITIEVATGDRPVDHRAEAAAADRSASVLLTVRDTGTGMTPDVQERIFEPFFTTKEAGRGTGLGLAAVQRIVTELEGDISLRTEPGSGTAFLIELPGIQAGVSEDRAALRTGPPIGRERVLVVEDEIGVRTFVGRVLTRHGYRVIEAPTTEAALAIAAPGGIDLLLSDIVLPGLDGTHLARRARERWPGLAVVFMSGYAQHPLTQNADGELLEKPFTAETLLSRVREALDSRQPD